ncbi:MAG: biotin/lipoyl-containing protein, partial [Burkholderiaceae bacterium]
MSAHLIKVPDIGEGIAEVELVEWLVQSGEAVAEDQSLAVVMTDKASVEIPSPVAGTVTELTGEAGQMLAVGSVLIRIETRADAGVEARPATGAQAKPEASARVETTAEAVDTDGPARARAA